MIPYIVREIEVQSHVGQVCQSDSVLHAQPIVGAPAFVLGFKFDGCLAMQRQELWHQGSLRLNTWGMRLSTKCL